MSRFATAMAATLVMVLTANVGLAAQPLQASIRPAWDNDRVLTILVLGSDAGLPRPGNPRGGRSDGIHIVAVDTRKMRATIVDIPRDSYINGSKVNAFMTMGGPERMKSVMSSYTGIKLDYVAMTNFRGLRLMVDAMGGVRIRLDQAIRDSASRSNLDAGRQKLRGRQALAFSRARKTVPGGDFGRTRHQGELLRAAHRQIRGRQSDLLTMTKLLAAFARNVDTDIPPDQLFRMAQLAVRIKPKNVKQVPLSGPTGFVGPESIVRLAPGSAFSDIRKGRIGR